MPTNYTTNTFNEIFREVYADRIEEFLSTSPQNIHDMISFLLKKQEVEESYKVTSHMPAWF